MSILGAIIAGGSARRFGSDKARALFNGRALIDLVGDGLNAQVAATVICGRALSESEQLAGWQSLDDRPAPDLGPLGGLCAALHYASHHGYGAVLSVGVDVIPLPSRLVGWLEEHSQRNTRAAVVDGQHLLGLWPSTLAGKLDRYLQNATDRSLRRWIAASGAISVAVPFEFTNINTLADLVALENQHAPRKPANSQGSATTFPVGERLSGMEETMTDPSNISTENQPKGAARNPSDTLDKDTSDVSPALPPTKPEEEEAGDKN